jgi:hypothetical protein
MGRDTPQRPWLQVCYDNGNWYTWSLVQLNPSSLGWGRDQDTDLLPLFPCKLRYPRTWQQPGGPLLPSYVTPGKAAQEDPPHTAHPGKLFLLISYPHTGPPPNILK